MMALFVIAANLALGTIAAHTIIRELQDQRIATLSNNDLILDKGHKQQEQAIKALAGRLEALEGKKK